ncbi:DNA repair protein endonuclease SAE2/CtIP C-terminus-domain-containing protein [Phyllosticta citribraziliensis]|uniref:DNA repair protein endonuclease SAE2/CtIP C-terminus-domain-containing protein n=1 Tax=Phyllosticta citribraziliensis TaxID=989973 RepID=A0ABR1LFQ5_9PEZI
MDQDDTFSQESQGLSAAHFETLQKSIRDEKNQYRHRIRVLERNNSTLLVRIDELEQENKSLKDQLAAALDHHSNAGRVDPPSEAQDDLPDFAGNCPASSPPATHSDTTHVSHEKWSELNQKYNALEQQHRQDAVAKERLQEKCIELKEKAKIWEDYFRKHGNPKRSDPGSSKSRGPPTPASVMSPLPEAAGLTEAAQILIPPATEQNHRMPPAHLRLQKKCATPIDQLTQRTPPGTVMKGVWKEPGHQVHPRSAITEPDSEISNGKLHQASDDGNEADFDGLGGGSKETRSSQTTQEEDHESNQARLSDARVQTSDDEMPQILSERTLKRKRRGARENPDFTVFQDNSNASQSSPASHVRVKKEPDESVPVSQILAPYRPTGSALDLDMTNQLKTPRKRRHLRTSANFSRRNRKVYPDVPALRQERSFSAPAELNRRLLPGAQRASNERRATRTEEIPDSDSEPIHNSSGDEENTGKVNSSIASPRKHLNTRPLIQVDANPRVPLPQPKFDSRPEKKRVKQSRGAKVINTVSESGEEKAPECEMAPEVSKESRRRLASLLEAETVLESLKLAKPSTPASSRTARRVHKPDPSGKTPQSEPMQRKTLASTPQTASKMPQRTSKRLLERYPQPLRSKPLEQLGINDFKINPVVNDGVSFAYNQVIRNREARRCLPGCIREECCGPTFRALVESGVDPPVEQGLWESPETDLTTDDKYLRAYLGSTYNKEAFQLKPLAEQQAVLEMAKMKAWANHSGRHKQVFQRERTPPGFWRTDFPATQELQRDREAARMEERRLVEERWREAMTEGGRWLFRDE